MTHYQSTPCRVPQVSLLRPGKAGGKLIPCERLASVSRTADSLFAVKSFFAVEMGFSRHRGLSLR